MRIPRPQHLIFPTALLGVAIYCLLGGNCRILTPDQKGFRLYLEGNYESAAAEFTDGLWKGVALFKAGDFEGAAGVFAGMDSPTGAYNQGNAMLMLGRYQSAIARYDRSLQLDGEFDDASVNREIARARMLALETQGGEMTGGMLAPDEIVINEGNSSPGSGEEQTDGGDPLSDAEIQAMWLRQVQTKPADFLRAKFAYQYATEETGDNSQ